MYYIIQNRLTEYSFQFITLIECEIMDLKNSVTI